MLGWRGSQPPRQASGVPDPLTEVFIYAARSWAGRRPRGAVDADFGDRFAAYVAKSIAEAKLQMSWINPDESYETAVATFVGALLDGKASAPFLGSVAAFVERPSPPQP